MGSSQRGQNSQMLLFSAGLSLLEEGASTGFSQGKAAAAYKGEIPLAAPKEF